MLGALCSAQHVLELHNQRVHGQPPPSAGWTWTGAGRALCYRNLVPGVCLRHIGSRQSLSEQRWALALGKLHLPSRTLPSPAASRQKQPADVTNTPTARSVPHPPAPGLCLLRPLHSPLGDSGSGTRFALLAAAGDSGHLRTPPVPAAGTVAPEHFQLLSSAPAGRACGEQPVDLPWVTW